GLADVILPARTIFKARGWRLEPHAFLLLDVHQASQLAAQYVPVPGYSSATDDDQLSQSRQRLEVLDAFGIRRPVIDLQFGKFRQVFQVTQVFAGHARANDAEASQLSAR